MLKLKTKLFDPLSYNVPSPKDIRKQIERMSHCPNCHFLVFENYWTDEVEEKNLRLCPTCGYKLSF